jgi:Undecaprenyl-phosphate glucose phosphotransferase
MDPGVSRKCRLTQMTDLSLFELRPLASAERGSQKKASACRLERLLVRAAVAEFLTVASVGFLTSVIYFKAVLTVWPPAEQYVGAALILAALVLLIALGFRQHVAIQSQSRDRYLRSALGAVLLAFSLFLSFMFLFKIGNWYSRGTFILQFFGVSTGLLITRGATLAYIRRAIQSGAVEARRAVLVGDPAACADIVTQLTNCGIRLVGVLSIRLGLGAAGRSIESVAKHPAEFVERCRGLKPDDIIFLATSTDLPRIARIIDTLSEVPVAVHIIPKGIDALWTAAEIANIGATVTIRVLRPPLSEFDRLSKRSFDICAAGLGLIVLSPLLLILSLAIKLDSRGPVLFRQNRHGYNNEVIPVIKFRTMTVLEDGETAATFRQAKTNDIRLTRLGRILRKTNLDELTQLFNVLSGEMSIVGPRPHPLALNAIFRERIALFSRRHNVKPGLTGWAQVHGWRGETDTVEKMGQRIQHDLYYIEHWSFMMDIKIILMTLFSRSAYLNAS